MKYIVYILRSMKDCGYYVGMTTNIDRRLKAHNKGRVRSTKSRSPFEVVYTEEFYERVSAREREKFLKSYRGSREKLEILDKV